MTKYASGGRDRIYQVRMCALLEERKVCGMSKEEFDRRHKEILHDCYHIDPPEIWEGGLKPLDLNDRTRVRSLFGFDAIVPGLA